MQSIPFNNFIFSPRLRVRRHIAYWTFQTFIWAAFWTIMGKPASFPEQLLNVAMWVPMFIIFGYPLVYIAIPHLLMNGKYIQFFLTVLSWSVAGLYINDAYRTYVIIPLHHSLGLDERLPHFLSLPSSYLSMTTSAAWSMIIKMYQLWIIKQKAWMKMQWEKLSAELQLLKAQVHPHFLFNTLNSIYSFSLKDSSKTPGLILKLSSLLSYMLYDCKAEKVRLEKELEIMKNYIELEKERHNNQMEISWNVENNTGGEMIAPLLLLPLLENAFKYGISKDIEQSWLSIDVMIKQGVLKCKIANSKSENISYHEDGAGISNVRKRLDFIYPGNYEFKLNDEAYFFVASLQINLSNTWHMPIGKQILTTNSEGAQASVLSLYS
jgi:two-component system, LytTR family, sensor histidine kinase AlgZ